ncbi:aconitate hydratase A [Capsulimonas corticalis]|uniref:Aconitate hydratase A n=1 Tax=Capsulimonas corticalis TaxID=2219043 RepID=A0A402CPC3_9BACT|nr:aconitate hydratase [Capsulimonas corticalis]BDI33129.1 aconitate hydratase A [Capsulimonas corticalis]
MSDAHNLFDTVQTFSYGSGKTGTYYSLPQLEKAGVGPISKLPVSIRIVLESVLRNFDGKRISEQDIKTLANWGATDERTAEIPFIVARIVLQDFTGVPLLVDLAAMRSTVARLGKDPSIIEPLVPVDLVIDHSVQVDYSEVNNALQLNMEIEFKRNQARYQFLKWGMQAFNGFSVVPPGIGIVHQVNLEYLAKGVLQKEGVFYPDTLVGTDSHTTMINGLGIVGWGVGGIEAEAGMLGQPVYFLTPDVVGVNLTGKLNPGVTATDLVLTITEMLRKAKVVGKFVEFHGEGAASLTLTDRATIGNMAPEYGATMGFFPVDEETCRYLTNTGRTEDQVSAFREYFKAQGLFGMPAAGDIEYSSQLSLDLSTVEPSVAGPKRPQDRINLTDVKAKFLELMEKPIADSGYNKSLAEINRKFVVLTGVAEGISHKTLPLTGGGEQAEDTVPDGNDPLESVKDTSAIGEIEMMQNRPTPDRVEDIPSGEFPSGVSSLSHGDVVIAAITSCTNTSNPSVMLAAGLVAKKAVEKGLTIRTSVKTSLAPGSRVVTEYLTKTGLQEYLDELGFQTVGYGCTTCIGNSGPLEPHLEETITKNDLVVASVLSGNRNFEARVHQNVKANFLMSPPLVVAFALAGRVDINLATDAIGKGKDGEEVFLKDLWPTSEEIGDALQAANDPETYRKLYSDFTEQNPLWADVPSSTGKVYEWDSQSTYIQDPPYFDKFGMDAGTAKDIKGARPLAIFGDSVTTDHISPAGAIKASSPAGLYLQEKGVEPQDFNSYGSRRGNDRVMMRGTFANVRIKNQMVPGVEGGVTVHYPAGEQMSIYDASIKYQAAGVPLIILAGQEYGTGSSRDWAAKGTNLLGVKAVIAQSFERIHRSNLVGMGVLPLQFIDGANAQSLGLDGSETFDLLGLEAGLAPRLQVTLVIHRKEGETQEVPVLLRIDTPIEVDYYLHGGILPFVLRQLLAG